MNRLTLLIVGLSAALTLLGCEDRVSPTESSAPRPAIANAASSEADGRYLVLFSAEQVPADLDQRVMNLGGSVEVSLGPIGVAAVIGLTENAAAELAAAADVRNVEPNPILSLAHEQAEAPDASTESTASEDLAPADATLSPTSAFFYRRQWNMRAVSADKAWAAGHFGSRDVVVAILDTGIDYLHPDLVGLVDLERSRSFAPEEDAVVKEAFPGRLPFTDVYWHGTGVASVVASNAKLVAGVNRYVTFLALKTLNRFQLGPLDRLLSGIVYAADQGADLINFSGNYTFNKSERPGTVAAVERAVNYAFRKGALTVSVSGNDAADLDHDGDQVRLPCEAANAICAHATAPTAAASVNGPWENVDASAPYSGFGRSAIDVAAPGGGGLPVPNRRVWVPCSQTLLFEPSHTPPPACQPPPCRRIEGPPKPGQPDCVAQGQGTSFAAPHVVGLAALLIEQLGHGNPALLRARILQSADDLGESGVDPLYGKGRINIGRALGLIE
jgi:lantibiotic leader peptide-processing serine protease